MSKQATTKLTDTVCQKFWLQIAKQVKCSTS